MRFSENMQNMLVKMSCAFMILVRSQPMHGLLIAQAAQVSTFEGAAASCCTDHQIDGRPSCAGSAATTAAIPSHSLPLMNSIGWLHRGCGTSLPRACAGLMRGIQTRCNASQAQLQSMDTGPHAWTRTWCRAGLARDILYGGTRTQQGVVDAMRCVLVPCSDPPAKSNVCCTSQCRQIERCQLLVLQPAVRVCMHMHLPRPGTMH